MDLSLNQLDSRIENSEIVIRINGVDAGKITEIPSNKLANTVRLSQKYGKIYECIRLYNCMPISIDITYSNLIKLYSIYKKSKIKRIKNTLTIILGTEIVGVIVCTKKEPVLLKHKETIKKSVVYYYVNNEYNPFVEKCSTVSYFCKDLVF